MKLTLTFLLTIAFIPGVVLAHNGIDHGSVAQINSETSAESDTGGNTGAGSSGNASASSHSTTIIDGSGDGTVEVHVKTNTDGEVHEQTIQKEVQGGVELRVSTTSTSKPATKSTPKSKAKAEVEVEIKNTNVLTQFSSSTFWRNFPTWFSFGSEATTSAEVHIEDDGRVLTMIERPQGTTTSRGGLGGLFSTIVNIFIFWR